MSVYIIEQKNIEGVMLGLMRQLERLAPHPDHPHHSGPLFISLDPHIKPAADYDGMLGEMMIGSVLGDAFSGAASESWDLAIECASEFIKDCPANTNFKIGQKNVISGQFNNRLTHQKLMKAYKADLPKRLGLERWLAYYQRKLYALRKQAVLYAPAA